MDVVGPGYGDEGAGEVLGFVVGEDEDGDHSVKDSRARLEVVEGRCDASGVLRLRLTQSRQTSLRMTCSYLF